MVTATRNPLLPPPQTKILLHRTVLLSNTAATTLKSALCLLCLVREQGQGWRAALQTPVSPWCGCAWSTTPAPQVPQLCTDQPEQHHRKCLWPELLHLLQGFRTQLSSKVFPLRHPSTSSRASQALFRNKP